MLKRTFEHYLKPWASYCLVGSLCSACVFEWRSNESKTDEQHGEPKLWQAKVLARYPHNPRSFTQGLLFDAQTQHIYESTGQYGQSRLRKLRLKDGKLLSEVSLPNNLFGEGLTRIEHIFFQLTWKAGQARAYRETVEGFRRVPQLDFRYQGEGWGLTHVDNQLVMSDGSARLRFYDFETIKEGQKTQAATLKPSRSLVVRDRNGPVKNLNELEYFEGKIWANIWHAQVIIGIHPESGRVTDRLELKTATLFPHALTDPRRRNPEFVMNGIAYDEHTQTLILTGKGWPYLFRIQRTQRIDPKGQ